MILHSINESIVEDAALRVVLQLRLLSGKLRVASGQVAIEERICPTA